MGQLFLRQELLAQFVAFRLAVDRLFILDFLQIEIYVFWIFCKSKFTIFGFLEKQNLRFLDFWKIKIYDFWIFGKSKFTILTTTFPFLDPKSVILSLRKNPNFVPTSKSKISLPPKIPNFVIT